MRRHDDRDVIYTCVGRWGTTATSGVSKVVTPANKSTKVTAVMLVSNQGFIQVFADRTAPSMIGYADCCLSLWRCALRWKSERYIQKCLNKWIGSDPYRNTHNSTTFNPLHAPTTSPQIPHHQNVQHSTIGYHSNNRASIFSTFIKWKKMELIPYRKMKYSKSGLFYCMRWVGQSNL